MTAFRYQATGLWKRKRGFPKPSPAWQVSAYHQVMGKLPPMKRDDWQWDYNPRSSISRKRLEEFLNESSRNT